MTDREAAAESIDKHDQATLRRQEEFRAADDHVARAFGRIPAVRKVVLFGSVAAPLARTSTWPSG